MRTDDGMRCNEDLAFAIYHLAYENAFHIHTHARARKSMPKTI